MNQIKKFLEKVKIDRIASAIVAIIIGIMFVVLPNESTNILCLICGIMLIIGGALAITYFALYGFLAQGRALVIGTALLVVGILCLVKPGTVTSVLTIIFGIYIIIDGASTLIDSLCCAKAKISGWILLLIFSVLLITLGVIVMFGSFDTVMIFAGISLIVDGVFDIISISVFSHRIKDAKEKVEVEIVE